MDRITNLNIISDLLTFEEVSQEKWTALSHVFAHFSHQLSLFGSNHIKYYKSNCSPITNAYFVMNNQFTLFFNLAVDIKSEPIRLSSNVSNQIRNNTFVPQSNESNRSRIRFAHLYIRLPLFLKTLVAPWLLASCQF